MTACGMHGIITRGSLKDAGSTNMDYNNDELTPFEKNLQQFFPEIFNLHLYGKIEPHIWEAIDVVIEMRRVQARGKIEIFFSKGHIEAINKTQDMMQQKSYRPGYEEDVDK